MRGSACDGRALCLLSARDVADERRGAPCVKSSSPPFKWSILRCDGSRVPGFASRGRAGVNIAVGADDTSLSNDSLLSRDEGVVAPRLARGTPVRALANTSRMLDWGLWECSVSDSIMVDTSRSSDLSAPALMSTLLSSSRKLETIWRPLDDRRGSSMSVMKTLKRTSAGEPRTFTKHEAHSHVTGWRATKTTLTPDLHDCACISSLILQCATSLRYSPETQ